MGILGHGLGSKFKCLLDGGSLGKSLIPGVKVLVLLVLLEYIGEDNAHATLPHDK
jgi:hypothetical protein